MSSLVIQYSIDEDSWLLFIFCPFQKISIKHSAKYIYFLILLGTSQMYFHFHALQ